MLPFDAVLLRPVQVLLLQLRILLAAEPCRCAHGRTNEPSFGALPAILLDWDGSPSLPLRERGAIGSQEQLEQERSHFSSRSQF